MKIGNQGDGGGRPMIEFTPEQITQLEALAAVLTKGQIADYFSISETNKHRLLEIERFNCHISGSLISSNLIRFSQGIV